MEYTLEDLSATKKQVNVSVEKDEVNASIGATVALYRQNTDIKGFRKGKVPASVIEGRYRKQIYSEASTELVNYQLNQIMAELKITPVSRINFDGQELERDKEYSYKLEFEVIPEFELPDYKGIKAEEEEAQKNPEELEAVLKRLQESFAETKELEEKRPAKDNEVAVINFAVFDGDKAVDGVSADNFQLTLGQEQSLPEFEALVKSLAPGEFGEAQVPFPEDFLNPELAGKTLRLTCQVKSVHERVLPELDDELAKKAGGYENVEQLRKTIEDSYTNSRQQLYRSQAQKKILDEVLEGQKFEIPESMLEGQLAGMVQDSRQKLERQGKSLESSGQTEEQLKDELREQAETIVRSQIFLSRVAQAEKLEVDENELNQFFMQEAAQSGESYVNIRKAYEENNMIFAVRERLLADKAMDFIYESAEITKIPAKEKEQSEK